MTAGWRNLAIGTLGLTCATNIASALRHNPRNPPDAPSPSSASHEHKTYVTRASLPPCPGDLLGVGDDDDLTDVGVFHGRAEEEVGDVLTSG
ncbi:hypothetical protein SAMN05216259_104523 [Actinacidiphila guanduensis]|uniref:Uncharacterized protein n=1 Tax=Actinacidiphila guanduensis TaxID=310781 RepID=A0A1H0CE60_9ACTN|nr:hypothetical protein SAMN05216259_104523 [Actinacidiphila guanduensis]